MEIKKGKLEVWIMVLLILILIFLAIFKGA